MEINKTGKKKAPKYIDNGCNKIITPALLIPKS
jgi:hypothetical protein